MTEQKTLEVIVKDQDSHHGVEFEITEHNSHEADHKVNMAIEHIKAKRKEAEVFEVRITAKWVQRDSRAEHYLVVSP